MICNTGIALFTALLATTSAAPQFEHKAEYQYQTPIPIISQKTDVNPDGSYFYNYQTGNGIAAEEKGYVKNLGYPDKEIQTAQGYYLYPGPDGAQYSISYTADENGFVAQGAHLPTPPPIPEEILKALQSLPKDDTEYDERGFPIKSGGFRRRR